MKQKFESSLRMIFAITNIFLSVFGIIIVTLSSFLISDSSLFIPVLQQDALSSYNSSAILCLIGGVALFILGAVGLFSSVKSRYFIIPIFIYIISLVVVGMLLLSAIPIAFVFYGKMNAYLQQDFPVQFNVSSIANNNNNISMLEYSLSCCGVMEYTEYVNNNKAIPTTCECIKSKPNCNKELSIYGDGCKTRLERTNQMLALLGGLTAVVLCIEIFLLAVSPGIICLNYK